MNEYGDPYLSVSSTAATSAT